MNDTSVQSTEKIIIEHVKEDHHEESEHDEEQEAEYDSYINLKVNCRQL